MKKPEPAGRPNGSGLAASSRYRRLEVQLEVKHVVNPVVAVDQANVIADYDVAVSRRRRTELSVQVARRGPNGSTHIGRENESFPNLRLPFPMPMAVVIPKRVGVVPIPIARLLAIVVIESIVIVTIVVAVAIVIVMVPILVSTIVIMMVAIIMILSVSERYA
jgi:hypothetical protein